MDKIMTFFNSITSEQLEFGIFIGMMTLLAAGGIIGIGLIITEGDLFRPIKYRVYRGLTTVCFTIWMALNVIVGILVILMKQGVVSEFVDLHTPPARQMYVGISSIVLGFFAITLFLFLFRLRVKYEKKEEMPKGLKKIAKWFGFSTLGIAGLALSIIGILAIMGIYDISYERGTALIFFTILLLVSLLTGTGSVIIYLIFKCGFTIIKDEAEYVGRIFVGNNGHMYHFIASKRNLFGRVYYINEIARKLGNEFSCPVTLVEEMMSYKELKEIPIEEAKLKVDEDIRDHVFKNKIDDVSDYYYSTYSW